MNTLRRTFGENVKALRKQAGFKNRERFADAIHVSPSTLASWEQGRKMPNTLEDFIALCDFFGCDADFLLGRLKEKTHDLHFICSKTGLSERTATIFMEEPEIADALGCLDREELRSFTSTLDAAVDEIAASIAFLDANDPEEQYLVGVQRMRLETAVYKFQEQCRALINNWCDLERLLTQLKIRESAYYAYLAEQEANQQQELEAQRRRPQPSSMESFQVYLKAMEERQNG